MPRCCSQGVRSVRPSGPKGQQQQMRSSLRLKRALRTPRTMIRTMQTLQWRPIPSKGIPTTLKGAHEAGAAADCYTTSDEEEHRQNEGIEDTKNNLSAVGQLLMMSKERSGPVMKRPAAAADVICDTSKRSCLSAAGHRDNQRPAVTH